MEIKPIYEGQILSVISKPCYVIVEEMTGKKYGGESFPIKYVMSKNGDYLGDTKTAYRLVNKYGISVFEKRRPESGVCSIGYNLAKKKWFGWSHRAIASFGTKKQAMRFAASVS